MAIYNKESHIFIKGGHLFYKNEPDDEVFDLLHEGAANYISKNYGGDWENIPNQNTNKETGMNQYNNSTKA